MVRGSEVFSSHFSQSDFRTIAEGVCRVSATSAQILSPGAQRGFQRGVPFDTFFLPFDVYQKAVVVRGRNPAGHPGGTAEAGARQCEKHCARSCKAGYKPAGHAPGGGAEADTRCTVVRLSCKRQQKAGRRCRTHLARLLFEDAKRALYVFYSYSTPNVFPFIRATQAACKIQRGTSSPRMERISIFDLQGATFMRVSV